jgi:hypothetical protein
MKLRQVLSTILFVSGITVLIAGCVTASMALITPGIVAVVLGGFAILMANGR